MFLYSYNNLFKNNHLITIQIYELFYIDKFRKCCGNFS